MTQKATWKPAKAFWLAYGLAWLPYLTGLMLVFSSEQAPYLTALLQASRIVIPLALAGIGLVAIIQKVPWNPEAKSNFFTIQIGLALAFVGVTLLVITTVGGFLEWRSTGEFHFRLASPLTPLIVFNNLLVFFSISAMTYGLQFSVRLQEEAARALRAEMFRHRAELQVLRNQLNPHFLFNTLHSLQALVRLEPDRAEDALDQFGALMRFSLRSQNHGEDLVPLSEEWGFIQNYIELERLRLGDRLQCHADLDDDAMGALIPPLLLQPLVENAVRHAVAPRAKGGHIRLTAMLSGGTLHLEVTDNGPGCTQKTWQNAEGIGLENTRKRLATQFQGQARFAVTTSPGNGFKVKMVLPLSGEPE